MVFSWRQEGFLHSYKLLLRATFIDIYAIVMSGHLSAFMPLSCRDTYRHLTHCHIELLPGKGALFED